VEIAVDAVGFLLELRTYIRPPDVALFAEIPQTPYSCRQNQGIVAAICFHLLKQC